ncbi:MAG TPA: class I SAM-dependent methyltransferase [Candidatus Cybelea sp.]|nr:class I SAM-dependent methyltransferase [Candidatus Cybelea sp.]
MNDGTAGYEKDIEHLVQRFESISFAALHREVLSLFPSPPAAVLDIGAGSGRDAAAFAALGYEVTAVEPSAGLRQRAQALHPSSRIAWIDDRLPALGTLRGPFDVVMLTAVWMHLAPEERPRAMARVAALMKPGGLACLTLRHGAVPKGRRMFEVSGADTIRLAEAQGLVPIVHLENQVALSGAPGVTWTRLAFRKAGGLDAGTAAP